jgi:transcriptional regulator with XRE-family HTH domain
LPRTIREAAVIPQGFVKLVEEQRLAEGLSLRDVAQLAGLSPSFLSRVLSGERGLPSNEVLLDLAKALRIDPPELLLVQAERIPTRSLGKLSDGDLELVLKAIQGLVRSHRRTTKRSER